MQALIDSSEPTRASSFLPVALATLLTVGAVAGQEPRPNSSSSEPTSTLQEMTSSTAPYAMSLESPMKVRAEGYDYDHEILVALPASYSVSPERSYPVLWAMDGAMLFGLTTGTVNFLAMGNRIPEVIVIGVGHPSEEGVAGLGKRTFDLFPPGSGISDEGPAENYMKSLGFDFEQVQPLLKGDKFLSFLVDQLRPMLAEKYRFADDHAYFGHSAGGAFASYALLARPDAFDRMILGSGVNTLSLELEKQHAEKHDDLDVRLFIGAGDLEANNLGMSAQRIVSRTMLFAENLLLRQYPSLALRTKVYTDRDHFTVLPLILMDGLQHIYADEAAELPKMPW